MITMRLENCKSVDVYVDKIISTAYKLNEIEFEVKYEWIGKLLLAGLPNEYRPMIIGIESSGTKITVDAIKVKLLQDVKGNQEDSFKSKDNAALIASKNKRFSQKGIQLKPPVVCYNCNKSGHFARNCRQKVNMVTNHVSMKKKGD
ncbi:hypothetical protein PR048_005753 [Dryococelus australis]|uniref:CCHC-type domain-containing protein n=1 Tax=Dryococelus australis TaxID=614101 RepID=A0ABQ9IAA5_9NEOP|nr:hypothetical protein PR048_005753 [Dryococelus australis]